MKISPQFTPKLDPGFVPAALWNRAYAKAVARTPDSRDVTLAIRRPDATCWHHHTKLLPHKPEFTIDNWRYTERLAKFLLWALGGNELYVAGAPELAEQLSAYYATSDLGCFDHNFLGDTVFGKTFEVIACSREALPKESKIAKELGRNLDGYRIGFDLGGSDRKCAALINGEVVHSEEIKWAPYFEKEPYYHVAGIRDTLERAAKHLPRVDAIGGSAAGIYIDNEVRVASLFRGIEKDDFEKSVRPIFKELAKEWNVPMDIANDGDVTALAGAISLNENGVLGISMGTSLAAGYIDEHGHITGAINELAFAPVDYREDAPADEWSGDRGCGVQYFSQQAVGRLIPNSGIEVPADLALPEKLEIVQEKMIRGDERAAAIYETIGTYFGYSIAHYAEHYTFKHLLVLGRVSSGAGGEIINEQAKQVLKSEFPELAEKIKLQTPDEKMKRHGQAVAAASLPPIPVRQKVY
ncbi:ROK family protein [Rubellicoccus peritrichatus]|uniref:ROK family protein n=1 Tax=Rubellicoccus peritrichatus TaxID=3080537 RepID=A0AAQ3L797_9BACT|nr:ROK family protein [Puniceicoccus sp. CR14]WOO40904.1 ROK family protein [Puniceicoccus sp. CR14]